VGVARPTTDDALAVIPRDTGPDLGRLLSDLGVSQRIGASKLKSSVLIDLPDLDSTTEVHRHIVEDVLPRVDAVVWVFHTEFLAGLAPYESQFIFVLNQVDRLGDDASQVASDLTRMLEEDGFGSPRVLTSIASEVETEVTQLVAALTGRLSLKRTAISKLVTDLKIAANDGWREVGSMAGTDRLEDIGPDLMGLAAATFVSLGVEATDVLYQIGEG